MRVTATRCRHSRNGTRRTATARLGRAVRILRTRKRGSTATAIVMKVGIIPPPAQMNQEEIGFEISEYLTGRGQGVGTIIVMKVRNGVHISLPGTLSGQR